MARDLLYRAAEELETARENTAAADTSDRLETLAGQLRSQADREAVPALGVLDRVHRKLGTIETETDEPAVSEALESAREDILSFLATLDDRGMKQHGASRDAEPDGSS